MSINVNIKAVGYAIYPSKKSFPIHERFQCFQTPSVVTARIMANADPLQGYIDWLKEDIDEWDEEITEHDYEVWDETTGDFKVTGTKTINYRKLHIEELNKWLEQMKEKGLTIEVYDL